MENLNDLIWMDEDDNNSNGTQSTAEGLPMIQTCMDCFCYTTMGTDYSCIRDAFPHGSDGCM